MADYKVHCFNGVPKVILVCKERFSELGVSEDFFDGDWTHLNVKRPAHRQSASTIDKPKELQEMMNLAEKLSVEIPFVRTDFYSINHRVFFGEITFFPASGLAAFDPSEYDNLFGDWITLPVVGGVILRKGDCFFFANTDCKNDVPLKDHKIYTFNGEAKICMINQDRGHHTRADYFDREYKWLDFTWGYDHADGPPQKPLNYEKMFELAERLAAGTPELRVDFYEVNGRIYFGELTFFDGSGFDHIEPIEWDYRLGSWLELPKTEGK